MAKVEEKFNKRGANLVEVLPPEVNAIAYSLGVRVQFLAGGDDHRTLIMHLDPDEALRLAEQLIASARRRIAKT
ncbi:hypothetical protein [Stutzerimonas nitrititolerans]|uniref:hypothetical protein n=1 Tax=Stutzerimonas nitrititolerans TaxID=2482751 RepID=UPI0028AD1D44|nr:hypothetical protein [Stutzerimonas nitrititolerans]